MKWILHSSLVLATGLSLLVTTISAQETLPLQRKDNYLRRIPRSAIYIELFGNSGLYSVNYDYIWFYRPKLKNAIRIGGAIFPNNYYIEQSLVLEDNFILFPGNNHLELGLGLTLQRRFNGLCNQPERYAWENLWWGMGRIGYRYQTQDEGFFFRTGATPIFYSKNSCNCEFPYFQFWVGMSLGVSF